MGSLSLGGEKGKAVTAQREGKSRRKCGGSVDRHIVAVVPILANPPDPTLIGLLFEAGTHK